MFEKFTERARKVMSLARQESQRLNSDFIGTEHVLLGLVQEGGGVAVKALAKFKVDLQRIRQEVNRLVQPPASPSSMLGQIPFSPRAKRLIELAGEEASRTNSPVIGTGQLLVACLAEEEGIACKVLRNLDVNLPALQKIVFDLEEEGNAVTGGHPPEVEKSTIRITFYKKGGAGLGKALFVAGAQYVENGFLVVDGVTEADAGSTAAALAAQRSCDVYLVENAG